MEYSGTFTAYHFLNIVFSHSDGDMLLNCIDFKRVRKPTESRFSLTHAGCAGKTVTDPMRTRAIPERLRGM